MTDREKITEAFKQKQIKEKDYNELIELLDTLEAIK